MLTYTMEESELRIIFGQLKANEQQLMLYGMNLPFYDNMY